MVDKGGGWGVKIGQRTGGHTGIDRGGQYGELGGFKKRKGGREMAEEKNAERKT